MDEKRITRILGDLSFEVEKLKEQLQDLFLIQDKLKEDFKIFKTRESSLEQEIKKRLQTDKQTKEGFFLDKLPEKTPFYFNFKPLNNQILGISTGSQGVKTDKQTNNQTDKKPGEEGFSLEKGSKEIIETLGSAQKELRLKFKRLTPQEIKIFCAIYQLEEEKGSTNYKALSKKTNLSESSIRDYSRRLILKGIPIIKEKINNKEVSLKISSSLKKLASLETILTLRSS